MADINTLFELVKELHRGGVVQRSKGGTLVFTVPRHRSVKRSLLVSAVMRGLVLPVNAYGLHIGANDWLEKQKKLRKKAARA